MKYSLFLKFCLLKVEMTRLGGCKFAHTSRPEGKAFVWAGGRNWAGGPAAQGVGGLHIQRSIDFNEEGGCHFKGSGCLLIKVS